MSILIIGEEEHPRNPSNLNKPKTKSVSYLYFCISKGFFSGNGWMLSYPKKIIIKKYLVQIYAPDFSTGFYTQIKSAKPFS